MGSLLRNKAHLRKKILLVDLKHSFQIRCVFQNTDMHVYKCGLLIHENPALHRTVSFLRAGLMPHCPCISAPGVIRRPQKLNVHGALGCSQIGMLEMCFQ